MVEPDEVSLRVTVHYSGPATLERLADIMTTLGRLTAAAVALEESTRDAKPSEERFRFHMRSASSHSEDFVQVTGLGMESPLWLNLVIGGPSAGSVALIFRWLVAHADDVGAAIPKAVKAWEREWGEVRRLEQEALNAGVTVTETE